MKNNSNKKLNESTPFSIKYISVLIPIGILYFIGLIIYSTAFEIDRRVIPVSIIVFGALFLVGLVQTLSEKPTTQKGDIQS